MNLQIDPDFANLIPPLSTEERAQLEENIAAEGCRDPLVVWGNTLIDGHNRFEICTRLGLPYQTVEMEFESRDYAIEWIIKNQFGRRNISDYNRGILALRLKPIFEARARASYQENVGRPAKSSPKSDTITPLRTDAAIAELANMGKNKLRQIERIEAEAEPEIKALAASGDVSINLASQFIELPDEDKEIAVEAIAAQPDAAREVMREAVKHYRTINTGENEWYTPSEYADCARDVMGSIDLDPASNPEANLVIKAETFFTKEDDGLTKQWFGNVWLNPPYSRDLMPSFVEKLKTSYINGDVKNAILVSHNNTDTAWFHSLASVAGAICFPKKRIKFYRGDDVAAPTNGQAFFYLGSDIERFAHVFSEFGFVVTPYTDKS